MSLSGLYKGTTFLSQSPMGPMSWRRDIPQDPVTAAIVISSGLTTGIAAATGTLIAVGSLSGIALFAANMAISIALGYALNALTPKPNMPELAASSSYASVNTLQPAGPTANIYGSTRVGGVVFYQETTER
jgi:predicted phage tail protein